MKKLLSVVTNKYLLTAIGFFVWMMYFDQHDYFMMKERSKQLDDLKNNISYLDKEIAKMEQERTDLISNPGKLEKFAREQYFMKRDNEDLYVIEKN
jgi:cell division protein FtsB